MKLDVIPLSDGNRRVQLAYRHYNEEKPKIWTRDFFSHFSEYPFLSQGALNSMITFRCTEESEFLVFMWTDMTGIEHHLDVEWKKK